VHAFDLLAAPELAARGQFGKLSQPGYDPLDSEMGPALFERLPAPQLRPAATMAADTEAVCRNVLGMTDEEIAALAAQGVLELRQPVGAPTSG
jgi:crotonobetainyl-CoA:carnitine CoA-transferase CaiB-like acyl-CoA transferase